MPACITDGLGRTYPCQPPDMSMKSSWVDLVLVRANADFTRRLTVASPPRPRPSHHRARAGSAHVRPIRGCLTNGAHISMNILSTGRFRTPAINQDYICSSIDYRTPARQTPSAPVAMGPSGYLFRRMNKALRSAICHRSRYDSAIDDL